MMCTAIYLKKYEKLTDDLAFISPCIAKKLEISDPNTQGNIKYNVTFDNLMKYVRSHNMFHEMAEDEIEYGLGAVYPTPGGLKENVFWFCGEDVFISPVEGEKRAYEFLKDYTVNGFEITAFVRPVQGGIQSKRLVCQRFHFL